MKNILKVIGWFVIYIVLQLFVQLIPTIADVMSGITDDVMLNELAMGRMFTTTIISNTLFVILAIVICKARKVNLKTEWKIKRSGFKAYIMPCLISFLYSISFTLITYSAEENVNSTIHLGSDSYGVLGIPLAIAALLISAPITEEVLSRAILISTLKKSFSRKTVVIISAVVFGTMHIMAGGLPLVIGGALMGLIFAVIYEKTNSLSIAIAAHAFANLPDFILYSSPQINPVLKIGIVVISTAACVICLYRWCKSEKVSDI